MNLLKKPFLIFLSVLMLSGVVPAYADTTLTVNGMGAIIEDNTVQAEKDALKDAFEKALIIAALQYIPQSSHENLMAAVAEYIDTRGLKDIVQYKITSRNRQQGILRLTVDLKLKDDYLNEWLQTKVLTTPSKLKPTIILMISSDDEAGDKSYFWWENRGLAYSPFETLLVEALAGSGQNVIAAPPKHFDVNGGEIKIARDAGAQLVIAGQVSYVPVFEDIWGLNGEFRLMEADTGKLIGNWSISRRSDLTRKDMSSYIADIIASAVAARTDKMVMALSPVMHSKTLVISGTRDYTTYQAIINALKSMENVEKIELKSIRKHSLTHEIRIVGDYEDVLRSLTARQVANIDIRLKGDTATIQLIAR